MSASQLLADLRERGVKLWVEGSDLRFSARKGTLGRQATELLARHKAELLELLSVGEQPSPRSARAQARGFSLDDQAIDLASVQSWNLEEQDPYVRYIAPYKGFLYQRLGLAKQFVQADGCYLIDAKGNRYADFIAQFGAVPFGHTPEPIWQAIDVIRREARPNLAIISISKAAGELAQRLVEVAPPGLDHVIFTNSGAEAVEASIKLARARTGRLGILSTRDGFHGLTLAGMSATGRDFFQRGFGAPVAGFNYVPFGDLEALRSTLELQPDFFAAFMVEPIQGESGIFCAPPGYLAAALELCHRYGVLLIVDEVQTGLGRTGALFACETEGITPDILTIAKALGGGLVPVGACLYTRDVFTEHFDLRHGSTFAGSALACSAAMATIDELLKDNRRLIRQVDATGRRMQRQLRALQSEFPTLVADIRGRGLMIGLDLALDRMVETQSGLMAIMQEQGLLLYMIVSYLLNVEHVRVAPSFTHGTVIRIEPPLIADDAMCDRLVDAMRRVLGILERGDAAALLAHLMEGPVAPPPAEIPAPEPRALIPPRRAGERRTRFAFVLHLLVSGDLKRAEPTLARFTDEQLDKFHARVIDFVRPFPFDDLAVAAADGRVCEGELIVLPQLPAQLAGMSGRDAVELVQNAIEIAAERGADVVGLGGFSSIISEGGLALRPPPGVRLTSGNSLTSWAAMRAVETACAADGKALSDCTIAVVGAGGAIGHALSLMCAERAGELLLVGNPQAGAGLGKLRSAADDCRRHVAARAGEGRSFAPGSVAARIVAGAGTDAGAHITVTTDIDRDLPRADVVLTATNAVTPFIASRHLRRGAMVCDVSRPLNLQPELLAQRPDLRRVSGALVRAPESSVLGQIGEPDQHNVLVACATETIVLALSGHQARHLCGRLDVDTIEELGRLAERLGFRVVT
ncbi:MAG: aminotransferase class III-fold pyridoxal phosphate-dependent enzyme [Hyphomicrobiales bacterium]|nr:aminotransferase class III-fold pyridoxal phosphate-dependent enzyme [Hyphomicrobiales bacterium]